MQDLLDAPKSQTFGYDALKQLTHAEGAYGILNYAYDAVGDRTQLVDNGTVTDYSYTPDSNRLLQAGSDAYQYDETGNTVQAGDLSLSYNARGRLAQATPAHGKAGQYGYNALGQRVIKTVNHKTTLFAYDLNGHLIGKYDDAGNPVREYVYLNDTPIALLRPKGHQLEVLYIHSDHLGTPKLLTNDKEQVRWEATMRPFGQTEIKGKGVELPLRFPGQYLDDVTELHYNRFRFYAIGLGRYIRVDLLGIEGGPNRYAYADDDPVGHSDPTGLSTCGSGSLEVAIPDNPRFLYRFSECCNMHDDCYGTCESGKDGCDKSFYSCMKKKCGRYIFVPGLYVDCLKPAAIYYQAVHWFGGNPYDNAQDKACANCK